MREKKETQTQNEQPKTDAEKASVVAEALNQAANDQSDAGNGETSKNVDSSSNDSQESGNDDAVLKALNETLKRDFGSREEALKTVSNMNSMVGDQEIAKLREKATDADNFAVLVKGVSREEGISEDEARKKLLNEIKEGGSSEPEGKNTSDGNEIDREEFRKLKLQVEERNLVDSEPEAKHVLQQLKELSKVHGDQSLSEIYESSGLKPIAELAAEKEKEKQKQTTSTNPSSRQGYADSDVREINSLINQVRKTRSDSDKERLVKKVMDFNNR